MNFAKRVLSVLLAVLLLLAVCATAFAADDVDASKKRYNVVFVTDESGSMQYNDPENLRYQAIRRFIALMAQKGNYVGSVAFSNDIKASQNVQAVTGFAEKEAFAQKLVQKNPIGGTNIGLALLTAVEMLNEGRNEANPSVIILLSDGKTDLGSKEAMETSLNQKAEAIEMARQAGYQVYTISLNTDGSADNTELEQIAKATGGEFKEVSKAEDLEEVQTMYYTMIFGAIEGNSGEIKINDDGYAEKEFNVPGIGVEEFNVLLEGKVDRCDLTNADGHTYTQDELTKMMMSGDDFIVIKAEDPVGGTWKVAVYGAPGTVIDFRLLYNSDFYITTSISLEKDYKLNQTVTFGSVICDRRGEITDASYYEGFTATLHLTVNGVKQDLPMTLNNGGFTYDVELKEQGTYYAYISATNGECEAVSDEVYELNVDNEAPVASEKAPKGHANIWPIIGGKATVDLSGAATDPNGDELIYTVDSSAFMDEDYTLDGTTLTVHNFSISKGSFEIRATDPYGAYCTVTVAVTSTNIGVVMAILVVVGALIALIVIALIIRHLTQIPFMGTISIEPFDMESNAMTIPATMTPGRGRVRIESFGIGNCGLPAGSYFQAGGKDKHIYFVSKKPVYSDAVAGAVKKVPIDGCGLEVRICTDITLEKGISVTFDSLLNNN